MGEKFNYKTNAHIVDVDCTDDSAKDLCTEYGVSGYPTLKYFKKGGDHKGSSYEGGREFNDLKKFVTKNSKKPCNPGTLENCDKKDKKYIEEIKDLDTAKLQEEHDKMDKEIMEKRKERDDLDAQFEKQKDEAMATQKLAEEAKKAAGKLDDKYGHKVAILAAKLKGGEEKKDEL